MASMLDIHSRMPGGEDYDRISVMSKGSINSRASL